MPNPTLKPGTILDNPQWIEQYMLEWMGQNRYSRLIGSSGDKPIFYVNEVADRGEFVKVPLLAGLRKNGVSGNMPLEGREEIADQHIYNCKISHWRNAVAVTEWDERRQVVELKPEIRELLMQWSKKQLRNQITDALFSVGLNKPMHAPLRNPDPTQVIAGDPAIVYEQVQATAAELNTWVTDNADRVVFGKNTSVPAAGNFAGSIGALAATDTFGADMVDIMKEKAQLSHTATTYGIEPLSVGSDDEEGYVILASKGAFKQLRKDTDIKEFNKALVSGGGQDSGKSNPYFKAGDLLWDNVTIKEIPEMGEHSSTVGRMILLGKRAIALCNGDDTQVREQTRDYGHLHGIGIRESLGLGKVQREIYDANSALLKKIDFGTVTAFCKIA